MKKIFFTNNLTEELKVVVIKQADKGNIQAKLEMIIHNQGVINDKLHTLLSPRKSGKRKLKKNRG